MSKKEMQLASQLFERFFLESQGKPKTKVDLVYVLEDMGLKYPKVEAALDYLESRGLIERFDDKLFVTKFGIECARDERDISDLPKFERVWTQKPDQPTTEQPVESVLPSYLPPGGTFRPDKPQLTQITEDGQTSVHELPQRVVIGRAPDTDIRLMDLRSSKHHAEIVREGREYVLRDLGSANGTVLNGETIEHRVLQHDDLIIIGATQFVYQCPQEFTATMSDDVPTVPPPAPKVAPKSSPTARKPVARPRPSTKTKR